MSEPTELKQCPVARVEHNREMKTVGGPRGVLENFPPPHPAWLVEAVKSQKYPFLYAYQGGIELRCGDVVYIDGDKVHHLPALRYVESALIDALKEAGDVIESYHKTTGIDLGDASRMPFYSDTTKKIDAALKQAGVKRTSQQKNRLRR